MRNIHIKPTGNSSRLSFNKEGNLELHRLQWRKGTQHTYITSDEEIKANVYALINGVLCKTEIKEGKIVSRQLSGGATMDICKTEYLEIILTTDQDLIKDGVQAIDDEFLEWFVKNPSCGFVNVEKYNYTVKEIIYELPLNTKSYTYKIIIPKEEPKQETLEEANWKVIGTKEDTFYNGAKWQEERMYSEEEVYNIVAQTVARFCPSFGEKIRIEVTKEWFEQFKKK